MKVPVIYKPTDYYPEIITQFQPLFIKTQKYTKDIFQKVGNRYEMIPAVRERLLEISDNFIDFLGVEFFIHDVVLTGSLANYNWSEFSDVDLHIIIDYEDSNHNIDLLKEFFNAKLH